MAERSDGTVVYMGRMYSEREWKKLMRGTHYQYKWSNPQSHRTMRDAAKPPKGVRVPLALREYVDWAIRESR